MPEDQRCAREGIIPILPIILIWAMNYALARGAIVRLTLPNGHRLLAKRVDFVAGGVSAFGGGASSGCDQVLP